MQNKALILLSDIASGTEIASHTGIKCFTNINAENFLISPDLSYQVFTFLFINSYFISHTLSAVIGHGLNCVLPKDVEVLTANICECNFIFKKLFILY